MYMYMYVHIVYTLADTIVNMLGGINSYNNIRVHV